MMKCSCGVEINFKAVEIPKLADDEILVITIDDPHFDGAGVRNAIDHMEIVKGPRTLLLNNDVKMTIAKKDQIKIEEGE